VAFMSVRLEPHGRDLESISAGLVADAASRQAAADSRPPAVAPSGRTPR